MSTSDQPKGVTMSTSSTTPRLTAPVSGSPASHYPMTHVPAYKSPVVGAAVEAMLAYGAATRAYCRAIQEFTESRVPDYVLVEAALADVTDAQHALQTAIYAVHDATTKET